MRSYRQILFGLALFLALPAVASAADGVLEINQACVAIGCFPGDAPGFPVTIDRDQTGSYRLTSNLVNPDPDVTIIEIEDDHVTLDLNGFAVSGPVVCSGFGAGISCLPTGNGYGILGIQPVSGDSSGIVVKNGVVRGNAADGIWLAGASERVEGVLVVSNGGYGIDLEEGSAVVDCRVVRNGAPGIGGSLANEVRGNVAAGNKDSGISVGAGSVVTGNVVRGNGRAIVAGSASIVGNAVTDNGTAVQLDADAGYARNVLRNNGGTGAQVTSGVQIGPNLCQTNTTCP